MHLLRNKQATLLNVCRDTRSCVPEDTHRLWLLQLYSMMIMQRCLCYK